jgi:hypothetical protein
MITFIMDSTVPHLIEIRSVVSEIKPTDKLLYMCLLRAVFLRKKSINSFEDGRNPQSPIGRLKFGQNLGVSP